MHWSLKKKTHERNCMKAVVVENYDLIDNIALKDVAMPDLPADVRVRIGLRRSASSMA